MRPQPAPQVRSTMNRIVGDPFPVEGGRHDRASENQRLGASITQSVPAAASARLFRHPAIRKTQVFSLWPRAHLARTVAGILLCVKRPDEYVSGPRLSPIRVDSHESVKIKD